MDSMNETRGRRGLRPDMSEAQIPVRCWDGFKTGPSNPLEHRLTLAEEQEHGVTILALGCRVIIGMWATDEH